jgi:hypothetical protein
MMRRFPPPWTAEETDACFIVRDANGLALGYFYFEEGPGRRSTANLLSKDEARWMTVNFAKLPPRPVEPWDACAMRSHLGRSRLAERNGWRLGRWRHENGQVGGVDGLGPTHSGASRRRSSQIIGRVWSLTIHRKPRRPTR